MGAHDYSLGVLLKVFVACRLSGIHSIVFVLNDNNIAVAVKDEGANNNDRLVWVCFG